LLPFYSAADIPSPSQIQVDPDSETESDPAPARSAGPTVQFNNNTPTRTSSTTHTSTTRTTPTRTTPTRTTPTHTTTNTRTPTHTTAMSSENTLSKQLVNLGENRLFCTFQTPSGLEGGEAIISLYQDELYWVQCFRESQYGAPVLK
jgi:hypothetical protein